MSGRVVLELTPVALRGAVVSSWRRTTLHTVNIAWDPQQPEGGVAALRAAVPDADGVWVAVSSAFLHVAMTDLPPAPGEAREAMVALEPDRYFATSAPVRVALPPDSPVAFAADAAWLDRVLHLLGEWAPVMRVEAAPVAALAIHPADGEFAVPADHESVLVTVRQGRLTSVRRSATAAGAPTETEKTPAWGVLLREDAPLTGTLMTSAERRQVRTRLWRGVATAVLGAAAALAFCMFSFDRARERTLQALSAEAERLTQEVQPALAAQQTLLLRQREAELVRLTSANRPDPSAALAAVSALLPRDAVVLNARVTGNAWQIDGTAANAAALVRVLDADDRLDNVRTLSASSRFRDGRTTRESFSIAFDVRSSP